MPLSTGHKNKQKQWRKEARYVNAAMGSSHNGKKLRNTSRHDAKAAAPEMIAGLFERAGIHMPRAEAFRTLMHQLKENEEIPAEIGTNETV